MRDISFHQFLCYHEIIPIQGFWENCLLGMDVKIYESYYI